jgi:hypothetical protein
MNFVSSTFYSTSFLNPTKNFFSSQNSLLRSIWFRTCRTFLDNRHQQSWQFFAWGSKCFSPRSCSCTWWSDESSRRDIATVCKALVRSRGDRDHKLDEWWSSCRVLGGSTTTAWCNLEKFYEEDVVRTKLGCWMRNFGKSWISKMIEMTNYFFEIFLLFWKV